jgi:hypothetical protein
MTFSIGDRVTFGRKNGEKTLGTVVKINRKSIGVKTLERRGNRRSGVGRIWRVHPSLVSPVSDSSDRAGAEVGPAERRDEVLVNSALSKLTPAERSALNRRLMRR